MNSDSQETLRQDDGTNKILEAIGDLRREMNERFGKTEVRLTNIEGELREMKDLQMSFGVRLDRHEAMLLNMRADMKFCARKSKPGRGTFWNYSKK
ncbi:MAG TPA: hypothetical protein VF721_06535 [Pyrinomonadaceae bacterium]|jgi:hypothetical protein